MSPNGLFQRDGVLAGDHAGKIVPVPVGTVLAQFWLCGEIEVEPAQVCDPGSSEGCFGPPGVQPDQVDRGRGEGVFEVDFGKAGSQRVV